MLRRQKEKVKFIMPHWNPIVELQAHGALASMLRGMNLKDYSHWLPGLNHTISGILTGEAGGQI